jgi:hypothetical protein
MQLNRILTIELTHLHESCAQNSRETARVCGGFKFLLSINKYDARSCAVESHRELSQLRLDFYLPERAQVETTAPQWHI